MIKKMRPALRWHGGKWILAPWIISNFPQHKFYTEVFGGGASVLLRKSRVYSEVYNDMDGDVVNLFRVLQKPKSSAALIKKLHFTAFSRTEFDSAYRKTKNPIEAARRLIIRSYMGFGSNAHNADWKGGFRACSNRSGTTPAHDWANYPGKLNLIIERFRGVVIESRHAFDVLRQHDNPETLHYVDPPYVHSTRADARHDYNFEMTDDEHVQLAEVLKSLAGMVVLSGYKSELYDKLYSGWPRVERLSMADGARPRVECLWFNKNAVKKQNRLFELEAMCAS